MLYENKVRKILVGLSKNSSQLNCHQLCEMLVALLQKGFESGQLQVQFKNILLKFNELHFSLIARDHKFKFCRFY